MQVSVGCVYAVGIACKHKLWAKHCKANKREGGQIIDKRVLPGLEMDHVRP